MYRTLARPGLVTPARALQRPAWPYACNWDSPQADGLVAWWPALPWGGGMHDRCHGLFEATTVGGAPSQVSEPEYDVVQSFDGTDDNYAVPNAQTVGLQLAHLGPVSAFAWALHRTLSGTNEPVAFFGGQYWVCRFTSGTTGDAGPFGRNANITGLATNTWQHLGFTWTYSGSGSGTNQTYRDGLANSSATGTTTAAGTVEDFTIGRRVSFGFFDGLVADVRVYDRALSPAVVWQLWDPSTRWDLYYPLRQRVFVDMGAAAESSELLFARQHLSLP